MTVQNIKKDNTPYQNTNEECSPLLQRVSPPGSPSVPPPEQIQEIPTDIDNTPTPTPMDLCLTVHQEEAINAALLRCPSPLQKGILAGRIVASVKGKPTFFQKEALLRTIFACAQDLLRTPSLVALCFEKMKGNVKNLTAFEAYALNVALTIFTDKLQADTPFFNMVLREGFGYFKQPTALHHAAFCRMGHTVQTLELSGMGFTARDAKLLTQYFPNVTTIVAKRSTFGPEQLIHFRQLKYLKSLDLGESSIPRYPTSLTAAPA